MVPYLKNAKYANFIITKLIGDEHDKGFFKR